ncbi:2-hydroxychromene-2-carboxylate isomerase [Enhygromyxa salina]|uniref:2-hydroxychromene-2-carboxylate isomerase n=1 Tax=Enhygromyxa salina TaxID=215803 RepID=A0A0C2D570_9BACT|nr:2-hydroxychromene-2-carboxylate isomerase [Enhygromyxa salina]KIG16845.1 2-hydroxychromene-2-carboxylate isomerase [Enhygromyxa salina]
MSAPVEFWFDFISPYAYLAWQRIHGIVEARGRAVVYRPVLFASLLNHWGQLGPAEIAPKRIYAFKQVSRRAAALGVPMTPPPSHPFNPLLGLRLAALERQDLPTPRRRALIDALFAAVWGGGPGISDPQVVGQLLREAGFDAQALQAAATTAAHKQALVTQTQAGVKAGVFGIPAMIVDGELFWGEDSLDDLARFLDGEDPLDPEALQQWADLPASASRTAKR